MDDSFQARPEPQSLAQDARKQNLSKNGVLSGQDTPSFYKQMVQQQKQALQSMQHPSQSQDLSGGDSDDDLAYLLNKRDAPSPQQARTVSSRVENQQQRSAHRLNQSAHSNLQEFNESLFTIIDEIEQDEIRKSQGPQTASRQLAYQEQQHLVQL